MYYENGQIWNSINYNEGVQKGKEISYFENGQIKSVGNNKGCCDEWGQSFKEGKWSFYY